MIRPRVTTRASLPEGAAGGFRDKMDARPTRGRLMHPIGFDTRRSATLLAVAVASAFVAASFAQAVPASLLSNGGFESATRAADWPDDWPRPAGASWES